MIIKINGLDDKLNDSMLEIKLSKNQEVGYLA